MSPTRLTRGSSPEKTRRALGHDRIVGLGGIGRAQPRSILAFALGGVALIGPAPSGAYLAKELLFGLADRTGQWWWTVVMQAGGIFTASYLWLVLVNALAAGDAPVESREPARRGPELAALTLAICSLGLGLVLWEAYLAVPRVSPSNALGLDALSKLLWPVLGGAVLVVLVGRWGPRPPRAVVMAGPARRAALAVGDALEGVDGALRP